NIGLAETTRTATPPAGTPVITGDAPTQDSSDLQSPCDYDRLRRTLPQLVQGLAALHSAGKIHRDVKPSNIRVTSDGRAVLLDFGLVAELERRRGGEPGVIVGTVSYMAPEQCAGDVALTPAADWYALGVVLYQCRTGRLPFEGPGARVLLEKQMKVAPRASRICKGVPADLDALCAELLERDPSARPNGRALLARLGAEVSARGSQQSISKPSEFTGRD